MVVSPWAGSGSDGLKNEKVCTFLLKTVGKNRYSTIQSHTELKSFPENHNNGVKEYDS